MRSSGSGQEARARRQRLLPALAALGVDDAAALAARIERCAAEPTGERRWQRMVREVLAEPLPFTRIPFGVHRLCFAAAYRDRGRELPPAPAWLPQMAVDAGSGRGESAVRRLARRVGARGVADLHRWSVEHRAAFWDLMCGELRIACRGGRGPARRGGRWYPDARLNIAANCLPPPGADDQRPAIVFRDREDGPLGRVSRADLARLAYAVAGHCRERGLRPGARVALYLPMTVEAVAACLGVILAGCAAVSIADSFAAPQVAVRLRVTGASLAIVAAPTWERLRAAAPDLPAIVVGEPPGGRLGAADTPWERAAAAAPAEAVTCRAADHTNILFSSGTTGNPKAIPWTHLTPIKCAADARLLHDVRADEVLAWPTSLGWMMGPWLIYAALLNRAAIALYYPGPKGADFGRFVRDAGVGMLGLVPTLVRIWRRSGCMHGIDWRGIRRFSSTGECSDPDDQLYLMALAGYRPVIEYCGGTEIGGAYLAGTMEQPAAPAIFTTPAFGLDVDIRDERGRPAAAGELFLAPPSLGLSAELLDGDHDEVYLAGTPRADGRPLRRHGDRVQRLPGGCYRALGRVDDTMNLSGIKVSAAEIERAVAGVDGIGECAAVAVADRRGGPDRLVIYAVPTGPLPEPLPALQRAISERLNPLFRIAEVRLIDALPRTASNKVMRRALRAAAAAGAEEPGARPSGRETP